MKASQAIQRLAEIITKHGDLEINGGELLDDTPLGEIVVIDQDGYALDEGDERTEGLEIFLGM